MRAYAKAIVAGVVGTVLAVLVAIQSALSGGIDTSEWITISMVAISGVASAFGVYQTPNTED